MYAEASAFYTSSPGETSPQHHFEATSTDPRGQGQGSRPRSRPPPRVCHLCPISQHTQHAPPAPLTIAQVLRLRELSSPHHSKLDLLKALALEASALLQPLLGVGKLLALLFCQHTISTWNQINSPPLAKTGTAHRGVGW